MTTSRSLSPGSEDEQNEDKQQEDEQQEDEQQEHEQQGQEQEGPVIKSGTGFTSYADGLADVLQESLIISDGEEILLPRSEAYGSLTRAGR